MKFLTAKLDNGLEVVAEANPEAHSTALGFFVQTGARDETDAISGISHFLEHMVFKGSDARSGDDVNREFDEIGAHYNAYTSEENTVYYAAVLPEYQDRSVELLADLLRPALRGDDFDTEKQVIIEEIKMYEDQPPFGADDKCRAAFFAAHPLGRSVLGTAESIAALRPEQMREYYQRRYRPGNMLLAAAGRIDFDKLVAAARRACGGWQPRDAERKLPPAEPKAGFHVLVKESATQCYCIQIAAGPAATDSDRYAAKLLANVLGDDSGSRLYWELVDPGLVEQASLHHHDYQGAGMLLTYFSCDPADATDNLRRVLDVYRAAERTGVTAAELAQAKNKICSRVVLGSERPRGRLFVVGTNWAQRREYRDVKRDLDAVQAITLDQIAAVLEKYPLTKSTTFVVSSRDDIQGPK